MKDKNLGWNLENTYMGLPDIFYKLVEANPVTSPKLVMLNNSLALELGLDPDQLSKEENIEILAGNRPVEGGLLVAQAYGGHQFGHFTMLGDGRALLLGEQISPDGHRVDIQLKGSGRTPFSRGGDGRAALGPMLREYLISEAIHYLGIPSSRSLAVVETGDYVYREKPLKGAILTRTSSSHIRFGTFQYAEAWGSYYDIKAIADYSINRHYKEVENHENPYLGLLEKVIDAQASLIAKWKLVGFIHGVMNTDNMTVSGETIDYGPCAFMDIYHPDTVFSSIDRQGRYSYGNQSSIGGWNLSRFAETILVLLDENEDRAIEIAKEALKKFMPLYSDYWLDGMRAKLGLIDSREDDLGLIEELLTLMKEEGADYTNTFIGLTLDNYDDLDLFKNEDFKSWHGRWQARTRSQEASIDEVKSLMKKNNPYIIPRNYIVEEALEKAVEGDYSLFNDFLNEVKDPYAYRESQKEYTRLPPVSNKSYRTFCGT